MTSKIESYLSKQLYIRFGEYSIRQNYRPDWMEGLELDFYIDELKLAAEVQGVQHYSFVEFFHRNEKAFEDQKQRDANKRYLCKIHNIKLVEIYTEKDADLFVMEISERTKKQTPIERKKQDSLLLFKIPQRLRKIKTFIDLANEPSNDKKEVTRVYMYLKSNNSWVFKMRKLGYIKDDFIIDFVKAANNIKTKVDSYKRKGEQHD